MELGIKNRVPITLAPKKKKYLGINLIKCIQDLCKENYKALNEEIKVELKKWQDIPQYR